MRLDENTLFAVSGAIVVLTGVAFILRTAFGAPSPAARTWANSFCGGILATLSLVVWGFYPQAWWANAVANAALVFALGGIWAGLRQFNGRKSMLPVVAVVCGLVGVAAALPGPSGGGWAGAQPFFAAIAGFGLAAAVEIVRTDRTRDLLDGRILAVVLSLVGLYYLVRLVVFSVAGTESMLFRTWFGTAPTVFLNIMYVIIAATCLSSMLTASGELGKRQVRLLDEAAPAPGLVTRSVFEAELQAWLDRANRAWDALVLVYFDVTNLRQINEAFGREYGDEVIGIVGRIAIDNAPTASVVGYLGNGRFVVLSEPPRLREPVSIAEQLHTALVDTPIASLGGLRAIASFGVVTTDELGYEAPVLLAEARQAALAARERGDGRIATGDAVTASAAALTAR